MNKTKKNNDNKYLTFNLGNEVYGIHILEVKEIITMIDITHVPKMPNYVKGVINLRGKIVPIIDLREKFSFEKKEYDERACIIVTEFKTPSGNNLTGFTVDLVADVVELLEEQIVKIPENINETNQKNLKQIGKDGDKVIMILELKTLLDDESCTVENETEKILV